SSPSPLLRRRRHEKIVVRARRELVDALFDLRPEMPDQALHRPCRRIAQRADRVTLDLVGHVEKKIDLLLLRLAAHHARQYAPHPARALAARRALAAALV